MHAGTAQFWRLCAASRSGVMHAGCVTGTDLGRGAALCGLGLPWRTTTLRICNMRWGLGRSSVLQRARRVAAFSGRLVKGVRCHALLRPDPHSARCQRARAPQPCKKICSIPCSQQAIAASNITRVRAGNLESWSPVLCLASCCADRKQ